MVIPSAGAVVLLPFPFSDLSGAKLRPCLALADAGRNDWILCQITSRPYDDRTTIILSANSFVRGGLRLVSYARPGKLFTADVRVVTREVGQVKAQVLRQVLDTVVRILRQQKTS